MFSPKVIDAREADLTDRLRSAIPGGKLIRRSPAECWQRRDDLADVVDEKGEPTRPLTAEEEAFIVNERLLSTLDYRYWSERYAIVAKESADAEPLVPRWASQDLFLARLGRIEEDRYGVHPDGILVNCLKARQLGLSTESQVILAHRITMQTGIRGMVAGDTPDQSSAMFGIAEFVVENLPWWLKPPAVAPTLRGSVMSFKTGSSLKVLAGKSQRGGLQDQGKNKGNIGRGRTFSHVHLSELSTWERPEQIDDALLRGVPRRPRTFVVFESTAKGRHDWWHQQWLNTEKGLTRFANVFIPWYIEPDKYWLPAPPGWEPVPTTKDHAEAVERTSPKYCLGRTVRLSREQLYWYERERALADERGDLYKFYEEMPATAEDAFQHAGRSIFTPATLERLKTQERPPRAVLHVEPAKDIALLKEWERANAS